MGGARSKGSKGVEDFKPYITRSLPVGARITCADNSGAKIIEKHITFSNNLPGPDHKASLTIGDFKKYVSNIRLAECVIGDGVKKITKKELEIKKIARRSLAYSSDLKAGSKIKKIDLCALRPNKGISTFEYENLIGKILKRNVKKNTLLKLSDIS